MHCSVYYRTQENGEYLCQVVMSVAGLGQLGHLSELPARGDESGADVVLVEYQENNPGLDHWIAQTARQPEGPEIFLLVAEASLPVVWQAVKLGAREIFNRTTPITDFQEALVRVAKRQTHSDCHTARPTPRPGFVAGNRTEGGIPQHPD
jgi:hypothetical protein